MYGRDDLQVSTALEFVKRAENMFFSSGTFTPEKAIDYVRAEAESLGVSELRMEQHDDWWVVAADTDWLPEEQAGLRAFTELLPLPEAGVNASRSEILLTAFAQVVVTSRSGNIVDVVDRTGRAKEARELLAEVFEESVRVIAFLP